MKKHFRILLMAILSLFVLGAVFVISRLVTSPGEPVFFREAESGDVKEEMVEATPEPEVPSETIETVEDPKETPAPDPEEMPAPASEPPKGAQILENQGDIEIIIPDDQDTDGF